MHLNSLSWSCWSVHGENLNTNWTLSVPLGLHTWTSMSEETKLYELSCHILKLELNLTLYSSWMGIISLVPKCPSISIWKVSRYVSWTRWYNLVAATIIWSHTTRFLSTGLYKESGCRITVTDLKGLKCIWTYHRGVAGTYMERNWVHTELSLCHKSCTHGREWARKQNFQLSCHMLTIIYYYLGQF